MIHTLRQTTKWVFPWTWRVHTYCAPLLTVYAHIIYCMASTIVASCHTKCTHAGSNHACQATSIMMHFSIACTKKHTHQNTNKSLPGTKYKCYSMYMYMQSVSKPRTLSYLLSVLQHINELSNWPRMATTGLTFTLLCLVGIQGEPILNILQWLSTQSTRQYYIIMLVQSI